MTVVEDVSRRRGGREARKALRARPIPREEAAVRPGMEGGQYRPLSQRDMARIVDQCEHIHFYQRPLTARDMISGHDLDINTMYACMAGTSKHVGTSMVAPEHVAECLEILHYVAGGEEKWRARPFISQSNCF